MILFFAIRQMNYCPVSHLGENDFNFGKYLSATTNTNVRLFRTTVKLYSNIRFPHNCSARVCILKYKSTFLYPTLNNFLSPFRSSEFNIWMFELSSANYLVKKMVSVVE